MPGVVSARATAACGDAGPQPQRPRQRQHLLAARELLEAAGVAASDVTDEGSAGKRQEADLTRAAGGSSVQAPIDDDGGADSLVCPQQDEVVDARGSADLAFGDRRQVHVVLGLHRHPDRFGDLGEQVGFVPAGEVAGVAELAGRRVERPGRADDQAVQVRPVEAWLEHGGVESIRDVLQRGDPGSAPGADLGPPDDVAADVGDRRDDVARRDVERGDVREDRVDLVELGAAARTPFADTRGDDQTATLEPGQQLRRGRLGQTGQLTEPGARQRPVLEQQVEGGAVVHAAQQPRSARPHCTLPMTTPG